MISIPHIRGSQSSMMVEHYDNLDAKKNPKQRRFLNSLKEGRNDVLGHYRQRMGTGSSIAVGLKADRRLVYVRGKPVWKRIR